MIEASKAPLAKKELPALPEPSASELDEPIRPEDATIWVAYGDGWVSLEYLKQQRLLEKGLAVPQPEPVVQEVIPVVTRAPSNPKSSFAVPKQDVALEIRPEQPYVTYKINERHPEYNYSAFGNQLGQPNPYGQYQDKPYVSYPINDKHPSLDKFPPANRLPRYSSRNGVSPTPKPLRQSEDHQLGSSATLSPETEASILGEGVNGYKDTATVLYNQKQTNKSSVIGTKIFRYLNLIRSIIVCSYGIHNDLQTLSSDAIVAMGAKPLFVSTIFFLSLDMLIAFVKTFPGTLWCCWDVESWDAFESTTSIWALIADHDLLTDIFPLVTTLTLKIYCYRVAELLNSPQARDTILGDRISLLDLNNPLYINWVLLVIYATTLCFTILFHAFRRWFLLATKKRSPALGIWFIFKCVLLLLDLATQGLFLYSTLVFYGIDIFKPNPVLNVVLSIVVASPYISTIVNSVINLPIHFSFLKLKLDVAGIGESVSFIRIFKSAVNQAFTHWFVIFAQLPAIYIVAGTFWVRQILGSPIDLNTAFDVRDFFRLDSNLFLNTLIQFNVVLNFGTGVAAGALFWFSYVLDLLNMGLFK